MSMVTRIECTDDRISQHAIISFQSYRSEIPAREIPGKMNSAVMKFVLRQKPSVN